MKQFQNILIGLCTTLLSCVSVMTYNEIKEIREDVKQIVPVVATHTESIKTLQNDYSFLADKVDHTQLEVAKLYALKEDEIEVPKRKR